MELLRFFDSAAPAQGQVQAAAASAGTPDGTPEPAGLPAPAEVSLAELTLAGHLNGARQEPATA